MHVAKRYRSCRAVPGRLVLRRRTGQRVAATRSRLAPMASWCPSPQRARCRRSPHIGLPISAVREYGSSRDGTQAPTPRTGGAGRCAQRAALRVPDGVRRRDQRRRPLRADAGDRSVDATSASSRRDRRSTSWSPRIASVVITTWERARKVGASSAQVRLRVDPDRPAVIHYVDARAGHGVYIGIVVGGDAATLAMLPEIRPEPRPPRVARVRKNEVAVFLDVDEATTKILGWSSRGHGRVPLARLHPPRRPGASDRELDADALGARGRAAPGPSASSAL